MTARSNNCAGPRAKMKRISVIIGNFTEYRTSSRHAVWLKERCTKDLQNLLKTSDCVVFGVAKWSEILNCRLKTWQFMSVCWTEPLRGLMPWNTIWNMFPCCMCFILYGVFACSDAWAFLVLRGFTIAPPYQCVSSRGQWVSSDVIVWCRSCSIPARPLIRRSVLLWLILWNPPTLF